MKETDLTKEWIPYDGNYAKKMQDITLSNGDVVTMCWPNAGFWNCFDSENNPKYYGQRIPHTDATFVRLTHSRNW